MSGGIDGIKNNVSALPNESSAGSAQPLTGNRNGEGVRLAQTPAVKMEELLDEISMTRSQDTEKKNALERKANSKAGSRTEELALRCAQKVAEPDAPRKLQQLADSLKKLGQPTPQQLKDQLQEYFGDQTDQFEALEFLSELLSSTGGHDKLLDVVGEVRDELASEPSVLAGRNIGDVVDNFDGSRLEARDLYRNVALGFDSIGQACTQLKDKYGADKFDEVADWLISALGTDLQAAGPSADPVGLKSIQDDLATVRTARQVYSACIDLLSKLREM
jgi:type III secretion system YopN/LcrE/InvE/MxiC family regulator